MNQGGKIILSLILLLLTEDAPDLMGQVHQPSGTKPKEIIAKKVRNFVYASPHRYRIYIDDMLGEGIGYFDSDPRYHAHDMNCTTWAQTAIAHAYAKGEGDMTNVMDHIRYFDGVIGYSTRKHYTDSWLLLEPEPLKRVNLNFCRTPQKKEVVLDFDLFKRNKGYRCPIDHEDFNRITIDYLAPDDFLACTKNLEPGVYFIFPVGSDRYLQKFGTNGPMGLVHGIVLDVTEDEGSKQMTVHHASITRKDVIVKPLETYIHGRAAQLFLGYTLWELDPDWDYRAQDLSEVEQARIDALLECEARLIRNREKD